MALFAAVWLGAPFSAEATLVKIDATNLNVISLVVSGSGTLERFPASTVKELDLDEGSFVLRYNSATSPIPVVSFEVTSNGLIDFNGAQDPYMSGRGTDTLVVHGLAVSLDVRALDTFGPNILAASRNVFSSGTATVNLLPGGHRLYFQTGGLGVPRLVFHVTQKGTVDVVEVWDADTNVLAPGDAYIASGLGTDSLVVQGTPIIVDASALSTSNPALNAIGSMASGIFNSEGIAHVSVLPGSHFFYYNTVTRLSHYPRMYFTVKPDGTIGAVTVADRDLSVSPSTIVNASADHLVSGVGTTRLKILGAPVNLIVTGCDENFSLWDFGVFPEMTVNTVRVLPGGHRLNELPAPADIDFDFLVRASGLVDYVDGAAGSATLSGRGTDTLMVGRCDRPCKHRRADSTPGAASEPRRPGGEAELERLARRPLADRIWELRKRRIPRI